MHSQLQRANNQLRGARLPRSKLLISSVWNNPYAPVQSSEPRPTVLVTEKLGNAGLELLKQFANVDASFNLSPEELKAKAPLVDALIVRSGT
eukprot:CAMPEP_0202871258 /NCGR_PEP_ID=MMETSP1391-20130828/18214_1 /ASSEMBLY_ACC=CAM_ASM_000867 /TAXON_ID=1034604 /ORGANISM="Chlamydomonas leiostraca, Strain SAG 11-49" /LENGTH=91 /DNA_ID=CAMNT_0049552003 /DNA_START=32 /DNA_END=303 /DNA_ORIENTATION=+